MTWHSIEESLKLFQDRVLTQLGFADDGHISHDDSSDIGERIRRRYEEEKREAARHDKGWMREAGALDDWNDRRAS